MRGSFGGWSGDMYLGVRRAHRAWVAEATTAGALLELLDEVHAIAVADRA